jgi:malonyl CoA-acyl carrier protein transacylase
MPQSAPAEISAGLKRGGTRHAGPERDGSAEPVGVDLASANPRLTGHAHDTSIKLRPVIGRDAAASPNVGLPPPAPERLPDVHLFHAPDLTGLQDAIESDHSAMPAQPIDPTHPRVAFACEMAALPAKRRIASDLVAQAQATGRDLCSAEGVFFRRQAMQGEVAAVHSGGAAIYQGAGLALIQAVPSLVNGIRANEVGGHLAWMKIADCHPSNLDLITSTTFLGLVHANATRRIGLKPQAAVGLSMGELSAVIAHGAELQDINSVAAASQAFCEVHLGGESRAVQRYFSRLGVAGTRWVNYFVLASVEQLLPILATEPAVCVTVRNSPTQVVLGGEEVACRRVVKRFGPQRALPLPFSLAIHSPVVRECQDIFRRHFARVAQQNHVMTGGGRNGVRFYSNAFNAPYHVTPESFADAFTAQAAMMIDFPATILRAWEDGVRIFVEHGARGASTTAIAETLGDRPHVAVNLDQFERSGVAQFADAVALLIAAGVPLDLAALEQTAESAA